VKKEGNNEQTSSDTCGAALPHEYCLCTGIRELRPELARDRRWRWTDELCQYAMRSTIGQIIGHSEYAAFYNATTGAEIGNGTWDGYQGASDYHYIEFEVPVMLEGEVTYDYTIRTGSYPQINYRTLLYIKTMTVNQHKSKVHDTQRGNMNKILNT
jgi:uncharacterized cupin superfamily protein